jgi:hypothetical protein
VHPARRHQTLVSPSEHKHLFASQTANHPHGSTAADNDRHSLCDSPPATATASGLSDLHEGYKVGPDDAAPPFLDQVIDAPRWQAVTGIELTAEESNKIVEHARTGDHIEATQDVAREIVSRLGKERAGGIDRP